MGAACPRWGRRLAKATAPSVPFAVKVLTILSPQVTSIARDVAVLQKLRGVRAVQILSSRKKGDRDGRSSLCP
ncbi:MAG TPA: hypothetical protein VMT57_08000 [Candidatus Thermoplasmatota archaeon]|nr:hypothetical protein [Candidatus Thermoplasmatota archaeon]